MEFAGELVEVVYFLDDPMEIDDPMDIDEAGLNTGYPMWFF